MSVPNVSGIYVIQSKATGKYYFGQSIHMRERRKQHFGALGRGEHPNQHLQRHVSKYGLDDLDFTVVLPVARNQLNMCERLVLDEVYDDPDCVNMQSEPGQNPNATELMTFERRVQRMEMTLRRPLTDIELATFKAHPDIRADSVPIIRKIREMIERPLRATEREADKVRKKYFADCLKAYSKALPPRRSSHGAIRKCAQSFTLVHNDGRTYTSDMIKASATTLGVYYPSLKKLIRGVIPVHHGWRLLHHGEPETVHSVGHCPGVAFGSSAEI